MFKQILLLMLTDLLLQGCGSQAGNPSKPDDSTVVIPEIQYEVPGSITGESNLLSLTVSEEGEPANSFNLRLGAPENCGSIFNCKARRSHRVVESVNRIIRRITSQDSVRGTGRFSQKGPNARLSGRISSIESDDFAYQTTMCFDDQVFMHLKWSADTKHIVVTRDFSVDPLSYLATRPGKSRVEYQAFNDYSTVQILTETEWERPTDYNVDGDNLIEILESKILSDKSIEMKAVSDWYDTAPSQHEGDQYLVGKIAADATGEFVSYIKSGLCPNGFNEAAANLWNPSFDGSPRWCFGRAVETPALYNNAALTAALGRLEPIGIISKDQLTGVEFDAGLSCSD